MSYASPTNNSQQWLLQAPEFRVATMGLGGVDNDTRGWIMCTVSGIGG